jgi:hypothetical protein
MARSQCDIPLVSIGSLSTSHRAERESQWKEEEGRKEGRKEEERMKE